MWTSCEVRKSISKKCSLFLNGSSIGMAKGALEAMNGFNLYGDKGANWSVVYVDVVWMKIFIKSFYIHIIPGCS